ncbi:MAG: GNAT family N-acetyltransferase [Porcipelethomonas sp.]
MKIRRLNRSELNDALPLIWKVFCDYEAINYPEAGKQAFWEAIHSEEYLNMLNAYGAFEGKELTGIIAVRNEGMHLALFFVDGNHHRKGIGKSLWNAVLAENKSETITVHSSLFAVEIYKKLGFTPTDDVQENDGIKYVPMEYKQIRNIKNPRRTCT